MPVLITRRAELPEGRAPKHRLDPEPLRPHLAHDSIDVGRFCGRPHRCPLLEMSACEVPAVPVVMAAIMAALLPAVGEVSPRTGHGAHKRTSTRVLRPDWRTDLGPRICACPAPPPTLGGEPHHRFARLLGLVACCAPPRRVTIRRATAELRPSHAVQLGREPTRLAARRSRRRRD